jgi:hypothetical protein
VGPLRRSRKWIPAFVGMTSAWTIASLPEGVIPANGGIAPRFGGITLQLVSGDVIFRDGFDP